MARVIEVKFAEGFPSTSFANTGTAGSTFDAANATGYTPQAGEAFPEGSAIVGDPYDTSGSYLVGTGLDSVEPASVTMSCWCNFGGVPHDTELFQKLQSPGRTADALVIGTANQGLNFYALLNDATSGDNLLTDPSTSSYGVWHMVTCTFDSGTFIFTFYVDGVQVAQTTAADQINYASNGEWLICGGNGFSGQYDVPPCLSAEYFVEDTAWTADQVLAEYNRVFNLIYPPPPQPPPPPLPAASVNPITQNATGGADLGQDVSCFSGLDPSFTLVGGLANLGQALLHRLQTPRGGLFYDSNYGTDIRAYCNDTITAEKIAQVAAAVQAECVKDERVEACSASVNFDFTTKTLNIGLTGSTSSGPFQFILAVTSVTIELLEPT